jgi:hypothetical protein
MNSTVSAATPSPPSTTPARDTSALRTPPRPSRSSQDGFDSALRRAGERSAAGDDEASLRDGQEQHGAHDNLLAVAMPVVPRALAPLPMAAGLTAAPASVTGHAMAMQIAQPAWSASALSPHALGVSPQAWSVQLGDSGLPVQQLDMQRQASGLQLTLGTAGETRRLPLDRLRERLVGKGQVLQSLRQQPLPHDPAQDPQDP